MRQTQTVKVQVAQLEKEDGTLTESDKQAADESCKFCKTVFIDGNESTPPVTTIRSPPATASVSPISFSRGSELEKRKGLHPEKFIKKSHFGGSRSFKVTDVGTTGKLVGSACYGKQQVCVYLQPFSR